MPDDRLQGRPTIHTHLDDDGSHYTITVEISRNRRPGRAVIPSDLTPVELEVFLIGVRDTVRRKMGLRP